MEQGESVWISLCRERQRTLALDYL